MNELNFLVKSDANIFEAEVALTNKFKPCVLLTVGKEESDQFDIVITKKNLKKMLKEMTF